MRLQREWQLAASVPAWAWRFYRRHWPMIVGLSLVGSVQRLIVVNWTDDIPDAVALASEVVVMAARLLLLVAIWRLATPKGRPSLRHGRIFVAGHWLSLLLQCGLIMLASLVFDTGLEGLGALLPESTRQTYLAVLLFLKNPTIIAFTFVWLVGLARQLVVRPSTVDVRA
ncbi:hypothetical protein [Actinophytocola oryzae]|uniref:Uncharacterized protein n=1 Tax=Actinophytocola oryzae TaxID=502181 RepID=A0A4R7UQE7_9PSEU|nr:hypothetical protein [Actinophytocola oryzae]TDV34887.1 hypothetical protein CLV71_1376 [Actinophytocola oryzae]